MKRYGLLGIPAALLAGSCMAAPELWVGTFGYDDGLWDETRYPHVLADVNADDQADLVSFGDGGVYVSLSTGGGFTPPMLWLRDFGTEAGNWNGERHLRFVADVNADKRADVVGFGTAGVYVALSTGTDFRRAELWISNFAYDAGGWRVPHHPRFVADVNADSRADIIAFGVAGVYVALSTGSSFSRPSLWIDAENRTDD